VASFRRPISACLHDKAPETPCSRLLQNGREAPCRRRRPIGLLKGSRSSSERQTAARAFRDGSYAAYAALGVEALVRGSGYGSAIVPEPTARRLSASLKLRFQLLAPPLPSLALWPRLPPRISE